ncbi:hypothetical protein RRG08_044254 [Elysia crispata]|uniref:Uncharacterized protein n=1 Tax=Elysia crispata TaxID=231223 RepID=A0AAE1CNH7_9GAST|nr:hypothetical protein RRG08_044254 [Elysia crispata]
MIATSNSPFAPFMMCILLFRGGRVKPLHSFSSWCKVTVRFPSLNFSLIYETSPKPHETGSEPIRGSFTSVQEFDTQVGGLPSSDRVSAQEPGTRGDKLGFYVLGKPVGNQVKNFQHLNISNRVEICGDELTLQRLGGGGGGLQGRVELEVGEKRVASRVEICGDELTLQRWGGVEEGWPPGSRAVVMSSHFRVTEQQHVSQIVAKSAGLALSSTFYPLDDPRETLLQFEKSALISRVLSVSAHAVPGDTPDLPVTWYDFFLALIREVVPTTG